MTTNTQPNPMGLNGFEFVEFASPDSKHLESLFIGLGFSPVAKHKTKNITLFRQGDINFLINCEQNSFASQFSAKHGPSACGMAFKVNNAQKAYQLAINQKAKAYNGPTDHIAQDTPAIYGIGDSLLYFIDNDFYEASFEFGKTTDHYPKGVGLKLIDHLTHNVFPGNMETWANYYKKIFNFTQIRFFDIDGKRTGLTSRAMGSPCGKIKIPLNESKDEKSQIAEYLKEYNGEGIQHIAMTTNNIYETIEMLRVKGTDFMDSPDTYFEMINTRLPGHGEDVARLKKNKILIDGGEEQGGGLLLQIFTNTCIGPIFFEIIQRKGNQGFGEGNFQALFDSIELDQERRGVL